MFTTVKPRLSLFYLVWPFLALNSKDMSNVLLLATFFTNLCLLLSEYPFYEKGGYGEEKNGNWEKKRMETGRRKEWPPLYSTNTIAKRPPEWWPTATLTTLVNSKWQFVAILWVSVHTHAIKRCKWECLRQDMRALIYIAKQQNKMFCK